jgi:PAS domain S-box-containing protein
MRILVADDHEIVRRGICSILAAEPTLTVCSQAVDGRDAVAKAVALDPDLVIMDISMPNMNGLEATREIKRLLPKIEIVIVSQHEAPEMVHQALKAGARGYVMKSTISADLLTAIRKAKLHETFVNGVELASANHNLDAQEVFNRSAAYEKALRVSERFFREMINAIPAAIYTTDAEGRLTHFNPAAVKFSGRMPELGNDQWCVSWRLFWADGTPMPHDQCPMAVALKGGRIVEGVEAIAERPDGTRVWFTPYPRALRDEEGRIIGGINMLVDITRRKQSEQVTNLLAAIVESSDDAIISKSLDGVITSWNKSAERMFGYTAEEAIAQHITLIIPPRCRAEEVIILDRLKRGERVDHFETVRMRKDGGTIDVSLTISPVTDSAGRVVGASKVARNITEQKQIERELRESEERLRMSKERLRELAWGLENQVRTRTQELEQRNAEVLKQSELLQELSNRLLQSQDDQRRHIARELHDSAGQTLTVLGMSLSKLIRKVQQEAPNVAKDACEIQQVVQQLSREIRTMSYLLHPPLLDESGLGAALEWYTDGLRERSGLAISLDISEDFGRLPCDLELAIFRVVQECLTNIHRHSGSKSADIAITRDTQFVYVTVQDQGKGISPEKLAAIQTAGSGVGIRGIRERLRLFHGVMNIESNGYGTKISSVIPFCRDMSLSGPVEISSVQAAE